MPMGIRLCAFLVPWLLPASLLAQDGIRIVAVPDPLVLPVEPGRNAMLEVSVGGEPTVVFLAADPQRARAGFTAAGGGRWQLNLADPQVARLVRAAPDDVLAVFAEGDGRRQRSTVLRFTRAEPRPGSRECQARLAGTGAPVQVSMWRPNWLDPAQVERIEVRSDMADVDVVAHMGTTDCPLARDAERRAFVLTLDDGKRDAWRAAGRLELVGQRGAETQTWYEIQAIPDRLDLAREGGRFSVVQRRTAAVPGSRDYLRVRLGDLTAGQVLVEVSGADGRVFVAQRSLRTRDEVEFELFGGRYVLLVEKLVNLLIGDDFAELSVARAADRPPDAIGALLQRIAAAELTFVREGQDYTGDEAVRMLRAKLDAWRGELTVDTFIDEIASRSSTTGHAYQVRLRDGTVVEARRWLRSELARLPASAR